MDRRNFVKLCGSFLAMLGTHAAAAQTGTFKPYERVKLVNAQGAAIRSRHLVPGTNYLFHYPFAGTPCFLLNLGKPAMANVALATADKQSYVWPGGAGAGSAIVAFSAICPHQLSYPGKRQSFINYRADLSPVAGRKGVIVCCAHHSVFDPAQGAKVISGPVEQPLTAIALDYDAKADELHAVGTYGGERFEDFFSAFKHELNEEFGRGVARDPAVGTAEVVPLAEYTGQMIEC